jgi:hypothetical protein
MYSNQKGRSHEAVGLSCIKKLFNFANKPLKVHKKGKGYG